MLSDRQELPRSWAFGTRYLITKLLSSTNEDKVKADKIGNTVSALTSLIPVT